MMMYHGFLEHVLHLYEASWGVAASQGEGGAGVALCHGSPPSRLYQVSQAPPTATPPRPLFRMLCS